MPKLLILALSLFVSGSLASMASGVEAQDSIRQAMEDGDFAEARRILEGPRHGRTEAERLELLTEVCNAQVDYAAGIRYGEQAITTSPNSSNAHLQYAIAIRNKMRNVGRIKAMLALGSYKRSLRRALELDAENAEALEEQIGFFIQAPGIAGGDTKRARELIPELKAVNKVRGLEMEALLENAAGNPAQAIKILGEALDEDPENLALRNRYAAQLQKQERFREADIEFQKIAATEHDPQLARLALYQRARTRILGRFEQAKAIEMLAKYIEIAMDNQPRLPTRSNAYWRMGNAHEQLDQNSKARKAYAEALRLDPQNAQAKKSLKALPDS